VVEINPSVSYKVSENFAVGAGLRLIYSEGVVKSDSNGTGALVAKRDMEGDTIEFGYNLAMTYRPTPDINVAVTYRSNVDLKEEGEAELFVNAIDPLENFYEGKASVTVPLPAALNISVSKTWYEGYTVEFNYERTYWSTYETLDFEYATTLPAFDAPIAKNWKDTNTFRLGLTVKMNEKFTAMYGFAIDETPVPVDHIGFELPDSDAKIYSVGFRYQQTPSLSWGAAVLYDDKEELTLKEGGHEDQKNLLNKGGKFTDGGAILATVGLSYKF
jgi:long-chain fatty acid transport protein